MDSIGKNAKHEYQAWLIFIIYLTFIKLDKINQNVIGLIKNPHSTVSIHVQI